MTLRRVQIHCLLHVLALYTNTDCGHCIFKYSSGIFFSPTNRLNGKIAIVGGGGGTQLLERSCFVNPYSAVTRPFIHHLRPIRICDSNFVVSAAVRTREVLRCISIYYGVDRPEGILCGWQDVKIPVAFKRPRSFCLKWRRQVTTKHACALDPTKSKWADYAVVQE